MTVRRAAVVLTLILAGTAGAQEEVRRLTFRTRMTGTVNELGTIVRLDPVVSVNLNRYASIEAGIPLYFVKTDSPGGALAAAEGTGLGNAHVGLNLNFEHPAIVYRPSFTVTAPTGNEERGLSTGHVTWDWSNLFQRTAGRWTPYGVAGVSNTVADTPFFVRPFTSEGIAGHFEGGTLLAMSKTVGFGGSLYAIVPSGNQTVVSRVLKSDTTATPAVTMPGRMTAGQGQGQARGRGRDKQGVFETTPKTEGPATLMRDRGASVWVSLTPNRNVDFHLGYSRSTTYALNTVFFGVSFGL